MATMPNCTRTFIAIAIPGSLERRLADLQAELAPALPECRWSKAMPFHLTLAFLGDVENNELAEVCRVVATSGIASEPFELEVGSLGAFPTAANPRVIWAGARALNLEKLIDLQGSIVTAVTQIDHRPDDQRFHPHVTLGRIKHGSRRVNNVSRLIEQYRDWSAGQWLIDIVHIFASLPGATGPVYEVIGRCPLAGKKIKAGA